MLSLEQGDQAGAQDFFARGSALCQALLTKTPRLYRALYTLALAQLGSGQPDAALPTYQQALAVCAATGVVQEQLHVLRLLQSSPQPVARLEEALTLLERALVKEEATSGS
jgi:tetratricopeptide (TPR) repeat protein